MSRILGSDAATALLAQHAGHADAHDLLVLAGLVGIAILSCVRRR